jgi:hypothetical protein
MLSGNIREESMDNELEIKLMKESSDLSVFDKHPQQVLLFCATVGGEEYFFECVVTIERNMFKKLIEFKDSSLIFPLSILTNTIPQVFLHLILTF